MPAVFMIIGALIVVFNIAWIIRKDLDVDKSFNSVLNNKKDTVTDKDIELIELRKEFSETLLELQVEIEGLKDKIKDNVTASEEITVKKEHVPDDNKKVQVKNAVKMDEIKKLLNEGKSIEEVSELLSIGKGEVLLVKELYLK